MAINQVKCMQSIILLQKMVGEADCARLCAQTLIVQQTFPMNFPCEKCRQNY